VCVCARVRARARAVSITVVFCSCSGIFWMIMRWFQLPLLLLVSHLFLHMRSVSNVRSLYFRIFSAPLSHFCFLGWQPVLTYMFFFSSSRIMMFGVLLGMVLSVFTCSFHNMVTLPSCFYWFWYVLIPVFTPIFLRMLKCSWVMFFMYCSFASVGHADMTWSVFSSNCWHSLHLLSLCVKHFCCSIFCL
jgi:hypothetical protein